MTAATPHWAWRLSYFAHASLAVFLGVVGVLEFANPMVAAGLRELAVGILSYAFLLGVVWLHVRKSFWWTVGAVVWNAYGLTLGLLLSGPYSPTELFMNVFIPIALMILAIGCATSALLAARVGKTDAPVGQPSRS